MRKNKIKKSIALLIIAVTAFSLLSAFSDVPKDYWGYEEITAAQKAKIVDGYGDGRFGPNDPTTKEQMALMLYRVLKQRGDLKSEEDFSSKYEESLKACKISNWAYKEVAYGFEYGLWSADDFLEKGKVGGNNKIGRTMIAKWLCSAAGYVGGPLEVIEFSDVDLVSGTEYPYLDLVFRYGLMQGDGVSFMPERDTTRAEASAVCMRLLNKKITQGTKLSSDLSVYYGTVNNFSNGKKTFTVTFDDGSFKRLRIGDGASIILDGRVASFDALKAFSGKKITVSALSGDLNVVIAHSGAASFDGKEGVVIKSETKGDYTILNIAFDIGVVPFAVTKDTQIVNGKISVGSRVNIFCDGNELLEVKIL